MRCTGILVVFASAIGCAPGGVALRQSVSPLRQTGSELIHGSDLRAQDQQPPPVVTPDPPAAARESPPEFSYALYSDKQGHFSYDGAALALVKRPSHLQRVYADSARGEARPKHLIQELEYWFQQTGLAVADRTAALGCLVLPELQSNCRPPNWGFIEQFLGNSPEGLRLREVLAEAYARRAHQLGVRNDVTVAGVNLLLVGSLANAVLARVGVVEARTAVQKSLVPEAKAAKETTTLYRAVSEAEFAQIQQTGKFQAGPNSLGGKWFAESAEDAAKWGDILNGKGASRIVEMTLPKSTADQLMRLERLDGIGPARYGELDQLTGATIREVK